MIHRLGYAYLDVSDAVSYIYKKYYTEVINVIEYGLIAYVMFLFNKHAECTQC
jgi:hypothetical protein